MPKKVAYCTGFWCTNIGNAFFSLGVEHVLRQIFGDENVTVVSDYQTYTTGYGKRLYTHKNQLEYLSRLDVDYVVLAGPVLSKYFLTLWSDIIIQLEKRGIRYLILSAGMMKMDQKSLIACREFFKQHPSFVLCSRDRSTLESFGDLAECSYDGICYSFFAPDYYNPCGIDAKYITFNFDKTAEPVISIDDDETPDSFEFEGKWFQIKNNWLFSNIAAKTGRLSDALIYLSSFFPRKKAGRNR